jgi:hypothetical protein
VDKIFSPSRTRSKGRWKGGDNHEEVHQAEPEVFGPPAACYQAQFLKKRAITASESKERRFSSSKLAPCFRKP